MTVDTPALTNLCLTSHAQTPKENMSMPHLQIGRNNISMSSSKVVDVFGLELTVIPYSNNKPADPDL